MSTARLLLAAAVGLIFSGAPAQASYDSTPYICTPSGVTDGSAKYSSLSTNAGLILQTTAKGNSNVGCIMNSNYEIFKTISFTMLGTGDDASGPYVNVEGEYPDGSEAEAALSITKATKIKVNGTTTYQLRASQFPFTKDVKTYYSTIALFPGATDRKVVIGSIRINGKPLKNLLVTEIDCPMDEHP